MTTPTPTLFVIPYQKKIGRHRLQQCNCCHLLSGFPSKFQSSMIVIHYKNVRTQNIPKVDELKVHWVDDICKLIHEMCH